jgi:hypothetical protein
MLKVSILGASQKIVFSGHYDPRNYDPRNYGPRNYDPRNYKLRNSFDWEILPRFFSYCLEMVMEKSV